MLRSAARGRATPISSTDDAAAAAPSPRATGDLGAAEISISSRRPVQSDSRPPKCPPHGGSLEPRGQLGRDRTQCHPRPAAHRARQRGCARCRAAQLPDGGPRPADPDPGGGRGTLGARGDPGWARHRRRPRQAGARAGARPGDPPDRGGARADRPPRSPPGRVRGRAGSTGRARFGLLLPRRRGEALPPPRSMPGLRGADHALRHCRVAASPPPQPRQRAGRDRPGLREAGPSCPQRTKAGRRSRQAPGRA